MRKIIILALTALMMVGCVYEDRQSIDVGEIKIVTIDSCEYVRCRTSYGYNVYSHKGNCRFCKERRQKELEELIIKLKEE